ncbi:flagellar export chaperone FliS [Persephonella atlantica]|uniref:Flagellar export chaperone FliS n=1 Tax=Persephonella atlantica TaxID=2699429 RepID=A0ABS1GG07_9AQUI|nr:flagellar export chaperone FliS [Persephonella atlantica]MBK3331859.1 flagellar export chaperone FliS [Persephonella atlantica]
MSNPYSAYVKNMDNISSKEELLVKVLEEIISNLNVAMYALEEGDIKTKAETLTKVTDAIAILQASLDMEKGGEIAQNLSRLYDFCIEELLKANANNQIQHIKNVIEVIQPIYEGFKGALENIRN